MIVIICNRIGTKPLLLRTAWIPPRVSQYASDAYIAISHTPWHLMKILGFPVVSNWKQRPDNLQSISLSSRLYPSRLPKRLTAYFSYLLHRLHDQFSQLHVHTPHWLIRRKLIGMSWGQFKSTCEYSKKHGLMSRTATDDKGQQYRLRAGHFRHFLICSIIKNDFLKFLYQVNLTGSGLFT